MSQPPNTPPPINPYDAPERPGMSGTAKVLLGLGIGCGVLVVLCCGVIGLGSYAVVKVAKESTIEDPAQVADITEDVVTIAVPEELHPVLAVNMNLPVVGPVMKGAMYADADRKSQLIVGQINQSFGDRHNLETRLRSSMPKQQDKDLEVRESETLDTKVHGDVAHFTISRGVHENSNDEYWQVVGQFKGSGGPAILIFNGPADRITKDKLLDMLKSME